MRRWLASGALVLALLGVGCDNRAHTVDAPEPASVDTTPAKVFAFPEGFGNIAFKCNGTVGMYSPTHGEAARSIQVVKDDPNCLGR